MASSLHAEPVSLAPGLRRRLGWRLTSGARALGLWWGRAGCSLENECSGLGEQTGQSGGVVYAPNGRLRHSVQLGSPIYE